MIWAMAFVASRIVAAVVRRIRTVAIRIVIGVLRSLLTAVAACVVFSGGGRIWVCVRTVAACVVFSGRGRIWVCVHAVAARVRRPFRRGIRVVVRAVIVFAVHILNAVPFPSSGYVPVWD